MPPSQTQTQRIVRVKDSIENRRSRGEISCAECRRHKLKCDRNIPCSTCIRKGCQSICPNGTLVPTHGSSSGASNVDILKARIADMSNRVRQLEDALQISHSSVSSAPHPLLAPDLLDIKNGAVLSTPTERENESDSVDSGLLDSPGALSVSDRGTETYVGVPDPLHRLLSKHFEQAGEEPHAGCGPDVMTSAPISYLSKTFPFTPLYLPAREIQVYIEEMLPSYARASALAEAYLENISWFFRPVDREQTMEELIPTIYKRKQRPFAGHFAGQGSSQGSTSDGHCPTDPHMLALLLVVFAVGAAADLTLPPWNEEADLYYHLARTALGLKPVFDGSGLHAVQAIALLGAYDLFACRKDGVEGSWKLQTFSLSLAASIGLNRDPAHFKLSPRLVQRRRRVFWELYAADVWKSTVTGRPLIFTPDVVDCEFPEDTDAKLAEDGSEMPNSIWWLRYRYTKEVMLDVVTKLSAIRSVKYSEILAVDQKIREYDPDGMFSMTTRNTSAQEDGSGISSLIQYGQLLILKDSTLLLLHRAFFMRSLIEDPVNPIRTRFGPSFLSTYRSASSLISNTRQQFEYNSHYLLRLWPVWAHVLAACVTLGSIAACGSSSALAPQAYLQFNLAYEMISKVQMHPLIKTGLPMLSQLREQAEKALEKYGNRVPPHSPPPFHDDSQCAEKNAEEFNGLRSYGRLVRKGIVGGFGAAPPRPRDHLIDPMMSGMQAVSSASTQRQCSAPSSENGPRPLRGGTTDISAANPTSQPTRLSRNGDDSSPHRGTYHRSNSDDPNGRTLSSPRSANTTLGDRQDHALPAPHSPPTPGGPTSPVDCGTHETSISGDPSFMQVDFNLPPSNDPSSSVQNSGAFIDPALLSFPESPSSPGVFNPFTSFPDITNASAGPSTGSMPGLPSGQEQAHSGLDPLSFLTVSSPSRLSPEMAFQSDFDVSFDMRSSSGQENVASMLPDDMEAWRTFFQDSRFFGVGDNIPESERTTPK